MGSKKTKTTSNETATTTPNVPDYAAAPIQNYYQGVNGLLSGNFADYTTPANSVQQGVFDKAATLSDNANLPYRQTAAQTQTLLSNLNRAPTATTTTAAAPDPYGVTTVTRVPTPTTAQATVGDLGDPALASDTSGLADKQVNTYGGARALPFINDYLDPQLSSLVEASLANYDDAAGRQRAAYAAEGARNGAFGGSRYGIGEAQLFSDLTRNRALTEAELRNTAWNNALGAAQGDASNANQAGIASMQAQNARDELLGQLSTQLSLANAGAQNQFSESLFDAINQANQFNAQETNDMLSQVFGAETAAALQDAAARNAQASQVYSTEAGLNEFNAGQANDTSRFNVTAQQNNINTLLNGYQQLANMAQMGQQATGNALGQQLDIGNTLWQLQNQNSPLEQLKTGQGLLDPALLQAITGQTITSQGTSTSKESGGLLSSILGGAFGLGAAALGRK